MGLVLFVLGIQQSLIELMNIELILLASVLGAVVLVYLPYLVVAYNRVRLGYDMSAPRLMFEKFPPYAKRATWAHQNSFEALIIYAPAALMAYVTGVESMVAGYAAIAFLIVRFLYSLCYILDFALIRPLMFVLGLTCSGILFALSLLQVAG